MRTITCSNKQFIYRLTYRIGGIDIRIYEPRNGHLLSKTGLEAEIAHADLQGSQVVYEPDSVALSHCDVMLDDAEEIEVTEPYPSFFKISGPSEHPPFTGQIRHILYVLSERARLLYYSSCTMHASAIYDTLNKSAVLILGDKGSGKTITAIAACLSGRAKLIGNDLVILGLKDRHTAFLHGGTLRILLRKAAAEMLAIPEIDRLIPPPCPNTPALHDKVPFQAAQLGIETCVEAVPLGKIVRVDVHVRNQIACHTTAFQRNIEALRLYENASRYINVQTTPACLTSDGKISGYFTSIDTREIQATRQTIVNRLFDLPYAFISAPNPKVCAELALS